MLKFLFSFSSSCSWWSIFILALAVSALSLLLFLTYHLVVLPRSSPLRNLPGPDAKGLFGSNMFKVLHADHSAKTAEEYVKKYGKNVRVQGLGVHDHRLWTLDPVAISYVLNRSSTYQKPWPARAMISYVLGNGLTSLEGAQHAHQKRVIAPTFSNDSLMALLPIFFGKAQELKKRWDGILMETPEDVKLDVCSWSSRATIDVIGLAAFDYSFDAIQSETNEVYLAFRDMFEIAVSCGQNLKDVLSLYFPWIRTLFPDKRSRTVKRSHAMIRSVGRQLIEEKTQAILQTQLNPTTKLSSSKHKLRKDLLTRLITANLTPSKFPPLSTDELLNQITTFLGAGSDTTALSLTWTLWWISLDSELQGRLREEVLTVRVPVASETAEAMMSEPDAEDLWRQIDSLPLLGHIIKESIRLTPPFHSSVRVATEDDEIPTGEAVKMKDGSVRWSVPIRKGQMIHVNIEGFNLDKSVWGEDAWEFKPDRWNNLPQAVRDLPGTYSNLMTFSSGPRACMGVKLALFELKIFIHTLITHFTFSNPDKIVKANVVMLRPFANGKCSCPILVRPYHRPEQGEDKAEEG